MDFEQAADVAINNAKKLLPRAKDFSLEGIMLVGSNYEVSLSYLIEGEDPLDRSTQDSAPGLGALLKIMGRRREEKVFIVSNTGEFKGFRNIRK
ncbi:hypothetical protein [Acinetobacter chinensis]|nr:hypothetical protein [Acinetobacter chinensis]